MSLSINDAQIFSAALKRARKKKHLTQAQCAELLDHSVSFQKDLERRGVPMLSIENDQLVESVGQLRTRIQGFLELRGL